MYITTPLGEKILITSTTVRSLFKNGEEQTVCPLRFYNETLERTMERRPRPDKHNPLMHGKYFETKCIGSGRAGEEVHDLERMPVAKTALLQWEKEKIKAEKAGLPIPPEPIGRKYTYHERIDNQVNHFKKIARDFKFQLIPEINTQIRIYKYSPMFENVILRSDLDFLSPITFQNPHPRTKKVDNMALADLKLTADVNNKHDFNGAIPWAEPSRLDVTQLIMYHEMVKDIDYDLNEAMNPGSGQKLKMLFEPIKNIINSNMLILLYLVFDYGKPEQNWRMLNVEPTEARRTELIESIRKTVRKIEEMRDDGFPTMPLDSICKGCANDKCRQKSDFITV